MPDGKWEVTTEKDGTENKVIFDALVVCNGHHWNPRMPQYPGHFEGKLMHSHAVKRFSDFKDQKVLVIGGGNSACDVAVESSRVAASVDLSWRRGYWVAPKFIMGKPADIFSEKINWMPLLALAAGLRTKPEDKERQQLTIWATRTGRTVGITSSYHQ